MKSDGKSGRELPLKVKTPKSTTTILWRSFVLFILTIFTVIFVVSYFVLGNASVQNARDRVGDAGDEILKMLGQEEVSDRSIWVKITDYSMLEGIDVFVFDADGNAVLSSGIVSKETLEKVSETIKTNLGEWEEGKVKRFGLRHDNGWTFNYAACAERNGRKVALLVTYPYSPINAAVNQMELYILIIGAVALVIAFFISYVLANRLTVPIRNLSTTAEKLAEGDYGVQFNSVEYNEVAKLSSTLNYMKDEIKKADDFQKELLANISHDLKTPLTMIKAYASMIKEISGDDPEKREKHLQVIIDESDRLAGLVNDILATSKMNAGIEQQNKKVFNLTEILYGVINSFGYLQEGQGFTIMTDIDPNQYTYADEEKIKQVLYNLISNAVNYTGADKTVYISLKFVPQFNCVKFSVRDTGKGIEESELDHIWDRYYRSKELHNRPVKGTGLGLNIVKTILENHAINFGVDSKKGEGSTFYVDFPAVSSDPRPLTPDDEQ